MPQLDPSSYASQLFWLTVCFVVLYVLLARKLLPSVQSVLTMRANAVGEDIEQAKRLKNDAEMAREHYEKALVHARARSQAMLVETQVDISSRALDRQADVDKDIEKKLSESHAAITAATKDARSKIAGVAAELTSAITLTLTQKKPEAAKVDALVGSIIKEGKV